MKYLIDTCVFIFTVNDPRQLSAKQKSILTNRDNEFFLSIASIHEMAIKVRIGKLDFNAPLEQITGTVRKQQKIKLLPITEEQARGVASLERVGTHGDPFDLLILSQAKNLKMPVLTSDSKFPYYNGVTAIL